ncbi:MAG: M28 family peptidase [Haloferacaceae archaeon]
MADWIGETFTSETGWDHLERLVDLAPRMAGSAGERRAAEATRDALDGVGARDARLDEFEIQGWTRGESSVRAAGEPVAPDALALPRSPSGEATGRLVDVGHGLPEDFDRDLSGAVVMAASDVPDWYDRFLHRREKYYRAVEAGADAFLFRNHVEGRLAPTGSVGTDEAPVGTVPAVGVSAEDGARLARRHAGEEVTVAVEAETGRATSQNVHAELGPETEAAVLLTSHVDAHDIATGALDNGAGTATVVEVTRALAAREDDLESRVHVVCFGAEEVGLVGSSHDAAARGPGSVRAVLNCDGVVGARTLRLHTHGFDGLERAAERVRERFDHPVETTPELMPHSDHWPYVARGVPGYHATSATGDAGRGWGHTRADTLDKLESRTLREQAVLLTELAVALASADASVDDRDPDAIAEQAEREGLAAGMRVTGDWPF